MFDWFIGTMLDGGDIQFLWTYGVEGVHHGYEAEIICAGTRNEKTFGAGVFHMKENLETPGTAYTKNHIDPVMSLATFAEGYSDPVDLMAQPENLSSYALFAANSRPAWLVPSNEAMTMYNGDLTTLKNKLIANVIMGEKTYEEAMEEYARQGQAWSDATVEALNAK